jgi:prevent-host-death family protein
MFKTHVRPSRDLRDNYAELADAVKNHDQVVITNNGRGEAVLIGIEDYADYEEYLHKRYIREKLVEAETAAASTDVAWTGHDDFWREIEKLF